MYQLSNYVEDRKVLDLISGFSHGVKSHTNMNIDMIWNL